MEQDTITEAAFKYAAQRFPNGKDRDCGIVAQEQYACRAGFMAGAEWKKEQSYNNSDAIESLINMLSTPVAKRKGVFISKEDCEEWIKELKKK